jgi:predicted AlkP superfamily phosphohydrolase/phosphomutase
MTGVNQAKHGLFDFVQRRSDDYALEVTNASHIHAPTLYDIASQQGRRVITVNVPFTSPPRPVNGVVVGGPFAPALTRDMVYPSSYFEVVESIAPDYFILPDYDSSATDPLSDYAGKLLQGITLRERVTLYLLENEPWDLFQVVFMASDEAQHTYWKFQQDDQSGYNYVIRDVYQRIDQAIGKILKQIANEGHDRATTVIVMSDHGGGPLHLMVNLNRWLSDEGYLSFQAPRAIDPWTRAKGRLLKSAAHAYRRYVPARVRLNLRTKLGIERFDRLKGNLESALLASSINWKQTRSYSLGSGGNILINLKGREPEGTVEPGAEYELLRQEIAERLMGLVDPKTGEPIVARVYRREELYKGPFLEQAPDLIIEWRDYAYWGRGRYDSQAPIFETQEHFDMSDQPLSGAHRMEGILIAHGEGIRSDTEGEVAYLVDLAPTLLGLLGLPIPRYMDGTVLSALLEATIVDSLEFSTDSPEVPSLDEFTYSSSEEARIAQHLKNLGYL